MKILILLLIASVALCIKTTCSGNCPSKQCLGCPCGQTANPINIAVWCAQYTWNQNCCRCIVQAESGGNANRINFSLQTYYSVGLLQINEVKMDIVSNFGRRVRVSRAYLALLVTIWNAQKTYTTILETGALGTVIRLVAADDIINHSIATIYKIFTSGSNFPLYFRSICFKLKIYLILLPGLIYSSLDSIRIWLW
jgi:hypothetical protein